MRALKNCSSIGSPFWKRSSFRYSWKLRCRLCVAQGLSARRRSATQRLGLRARRPARRGAGTGRAHSKVQAVAVRQRAVDVEQHSLERACAAAGGTPKQRRRLSASAIRAEARTAAILAPGARQRAWRRQAWPRPRCVALRLCRRRHRGARCCSGAAAADGTERRTQHGAAAAEDAAHPRPSRNRERGLQLRSGFLPFLDQRRRFWALCAAAQRLECDAPCRGRDVGTLAARRGAPALAERGFRG
jgi:hypothetical protein